MRNPQGKEYGKFTSGEKLVENLLCTKRESLVATMAWKREFLDDLQVRG